MTKKGMMMKRVNRYLVLAVATALMFFAAGTILAQDYQNSAGSGSGEWGNWGNWGSGFGAQNQVQLTPTQARQQLLGHYREMLQVSNDDEWNLIQALIQKILDISASIDSKPLPEAAVLQQVVSAKGTPAEIQAALKQYLAARQAKQAALLEAQEALRQVLTVRQEAVAVYDGLLP
jgi:hypothetical protein